MAGTWQQTHSKMAKRTNIEELTTTCVYYFDFANGDVDTAMADSDCADRHAVDVQTDQLSRGGNSTSFTDSFQIIWVAAELDAWALDHVQWFATNMTQLLIQHLPECIAWIPFAIDSLQREEEKQGKPHQRVCQETNDWATDTAEATGVRSVPQHPGVLWSTEL